jgi:F0F1-type ATP synthase epsilon subunit
MKRSSRMNERLRLTVLTPVEALLEDVEVAWIKAQLAGGVPIGIWPGHASLLAETVPAPLRYAGADGEEHLALQAGILRIKPSGEVTVLTGGRISEEGERHDE